MSDDKENKQEAKEQPPKKKKYQSVRLVESQGESALVEWNDGSWKRAYIPLGEFDREKSRVEENVLTAGIPYGVDWSQADIQAVTAEDLCQELYKNGIWTLDDLGGNTKIVQVALLRLTNATRALVDVAQGKE